MIGATDVGLPVAAFIVSATTLALAGIGLRRKANEDYVATLEKRVADNERDITSLTGRMKACEDAREVLVKENLSLMRSLISRGDDPRNPGGTAR